MGTGPGWATGGDRGADGGGTSAGDPGAAGTPRPGEEAGGHGPDLVPAAVRATMLATEHWSLLGTRSMTWAEVMSRITIHLTISSAALVVLALVGQATDFGAGFHAVAIGLTSAILLLGLLTALRVHNASVDDSRLVLGMNRLRAAYVDLDPGMANYLVASTRDDEAGLMGTYTLGRPRSTLSHVAGSTVMFVHVVNTLVAGALGGLVADAAGLGPGAVAAVVGVAALGHLAAALTVGRRTFGSTGPPAAAVSERGVPRG